MGRGEVGEDEVGEPADVSDLPTLDADLGATDCGEHRGAFAPGTVVRDRYRVVRELGRGGFGVVYEVRHVTLGRVYALKHVPAARLSRLARARLLREAKSASAVKHPCVVEVYDFGELSDGSSYVLMELVDGVTLSEYLDGDAMGFELAREIGQGVAMALQAAHAVGVVHRDVKPENILVCRDANDRLLVKVLDFGIAHVTGAERLTLAGRVVGTPCYMSPEQCLGETVDARSDIYALGIVLYEMLTGAPPFDGDDVIEVMREQVLCAPPELPEDGSLTERERETRELVFRMLAKDANERPASMREVLAVLAPEDRPAPPATQSRPVGNRRRRQGLAMLAFAASATAVMASVAWWTHRERLASRSEPAARLEVPHVPSYDVPISPPPSPAPPAERPEITLHTTPMGVEVWRGEQRVGLTPLTLDTPDGLDELTLRAPGYRPTTITLGPESHAELHVGLPPLQRARRGAPARLPREPRGPPGDSIAPDLLDPWQQPASEVTEP